MYSSTIFMPLEQVLMFLTSWPSYGIQCLTNASIAFCCPSPR